MESLKERLDDAKRRLDALVVALEPDEKRRSLRELEVETLKVDFWADGEHARRTMAQIDFLQGQIQAVEHLGQRIEDVSAVIGEVELQGEVEEEIAAIEQEVRKLEITTFLSGRYDRSDAILAIHAGQGGTEAMDWAQMLFRMYLRFAERKGWGIEVVDETPGEEAGIKSATMLINGQYAYGYLKKEAGTHRLVRQSPFNADKLRQTSFALVEVLPQMEETNEIEVKDQDLEWQFFRSSSQGGQNVQKVSTAVRLTHKPTGITVTSQSQRYQEQNRKIALALLRAKLWLRQQAEDKERMRRIKGEYRPASWGMQIRSYVLHPYKMVKDLRTGWEVSDTDSVLDGELDSFIDAQLQAVQEGKR